VAVVIANYVEGLLETVLSSSVIEMWFVLVCRIGKMSVRMFTKYKEGNKQTQPTE